MQHVIIGLVIWVAGVSEWLKEPDCKSGGLRPTEVQILPPAPVNPQTVKLVARVAQTAEHRHGKAEVAGSIPAPGSIPFPVGGQDEFLAKVCLVVNS